MALVPKISVVTVDNTTGTSITLQDTTGAYNVSTNPGGYGSPNIATTDLDWALLWFRNYADTDYTKEKLTSLTALLASGENIEGFTDGIFDDGVWEVKYYPIVAHPISPGVDTTITWTVGSKTFNLTTASTVLAGASAILIKNLDTEKLYFLDPAVPASSTQATVTEVLPSAGTGLVAVAYEADTRFLESHAADDCIAIKTGLIVKECSCFDPEMQEMLLRYGKREAADIHFTVKQNYQAAHDLITQLTSYCDNTSKCSC